MILPAVRIFIAISTKPVKAVKLAKMFITGIVVFMVMIPQPAIVTKHPCRVFFALRQVIEILLFLLRAIGFVTCIPSVLSVIKRFGRLSNFGREIIPRGVPVVLVVETLANTNHAEPVPLVLADTSPAHVVESIGSTSVVPNIGVISQVGCGLLFFPCELTPIEPVSRRTFATLAVHDELLLEHFDPEAAPMLSLFNARPRPLLAPTKASMCALAFLAVITGAILLFLFGGGPG